MIQYDRLGTLMNKRVPSRSTFNKTPFVGLGVHKLCSKNACETLN